jgi:ketosteroid isomerase-like protein
VSQENVEIVRHAIEVFNRDGAEAVTGFFDPEIEWHDTAEQPDASVHQGHEGFLEAVEQYAGGFDDFRVLIEEIFDHGDQVIVYSRTEGRGRGSGATVQEQRAAIWTLRNGFILRVEWFGTRQEALKAVGLGE